MSNTEQRFTDAMGEFFANLGLTRTGGHIFAHLLICDPPEQSASDIMEATGASAGAINTMLRQLIGVGLVERRGEAGSKRLWYSVPPGAFTRMVVARLGVVTELRELAELGLEGLDQNPVRARRLKEMRKCYRFFEREFAELVERYSRLR